MNQLGPYEERIRELFPELTIESISINREGLLNDVVVVNRELVFRFAKTGFGFKDPLEEAKVLHFLRKYITIQIPEPFYESAELLAYRLIPGETLRRDRADETGRAGPTGYRGSTGTILQGTARHTSE